MYHLVCPECKNDIDLSKKEHVTIDDKLECDMCGILLAVTSISGTDVEAEIIDEGK
jgi:uncharacterized protein YbaR (Trm112 family)